MHMKAIVITFDRLPVHFLGCYGNRWIETPHFDRLAGMSALFDQHLAENVDPAASRHAWTTGCYTFAPPAGEPHDRPSIIRLLRDRRIVTNLIRERGAGEPHGDRENFNSAGEFAGQEGLDAAPKETSAAVTVDNALPAIEDLSRSDQPGLLWVHLRGVPVPWLAPRGYATLYLDLVDEENGAQELVESEPSEDDILDDEELDSGEEPEEDETQESAERLFDFSPEEFDRFLTERASFPTEKAARDGMSPGDRKIMRSLYGGYVTFLDRELGRLLDAIERSFEDTPPLVIVTAARGEQLDDVTSLEGMSAMLCDDVVHTPLFVRTPEMKQDIGSRRQALVQTVDLAPTLAEWFRLDSSSRSFDGKSLLPLVRNESDSSRDAVFLGNNGRVRAIRTREAYLVVPQNGSAFEGGGDIHAGLFLKPEDIWEINDVAKQSPDLVESLMAQLNRFLARTLTGTG